MKNVRMFRMPFETRHFNEGQPVWILYMSGDSAAKVRGKFRKKGRYVTAWVKWKTPPEIKTVAVIDSFAAMLDNFQFCRTDI